MFNKIIRILLQQIFRQFIVAIRSPYLIYYTIYTEIIKKINYVKHKSIHNILRLM